MTAVVGVLVLASLVAVLAGLVRPGWVRLRSRKQVLLAGVGAYLVLGVLGVASMPAAPPAPAERTSTSSGTVAGVTAPISTPAGATATGREAILAASGRIFAYCRFVERAEQVRAELARERGRSLVEGLQPGQTFTPARAVPVSLDPSLTRPAPWQIGAGDQVEVLARVTEGDRVAYRVRAGGQLGYVPAQALAGSFPPEDEIVYARTMTADLEKRLELPRQQLAEEVGATHQAIEAEAAAAGWRTYCR